MITFKIDGKKVNFPTRWKDVSFDTSIDLANIGTPSGQIAHLINMPVEEFERSTFSVGLDQIFHYAKFLRTNPRIERFPTTCGPYKIGREISTMGQLNAISEQCEIAARSKNNREIMECHANIAAIYCQGINETFDREKAVYLGKTFLTLPCEDILSTGIYFHSKAMSIVYQKPQDLFVKSIKFAKPESFIKRLWRSL